MHDEAQVVDRERFSTGHEYVEQRGAIDLAEFEPEFDYYVRLIERFHPLTPETRIFEIGAGTGWFEVLCALRGLSCTGLELSPLNVEFARELGRRHGVEPDIRLGSVEDFDMGSEAYDVIFATSVFEHVEHYGRAFARVYEALRPGGVFYFYSTNKFSPRSGEYPDYPLYGWLPYSIRRRIRVSRQGPAIVSSSGIDFNQFTYWQLRQHFASLGFSRVIDRIDYLDADTIAASSALKGAALGLIRTSPPLKVAARLFASGNAFVCVK
jgi:SAM-dependent methyltransferase